MSVHICPAKNTILLYSSVLVYEKTHSTIYTNIYIRTHMHYAIRKTHVYAYLQGIVLVQEALSGLKVVNVTRTLHLNIVFCPRWAWRPHRVIKQDILLTGPVTWH